MSAVRRLAILLAGLGLVGPVAADPEHPDSSLYNRRYETTRPDGTKKTVIELAADAENGAPPPPAAPPAAPVAEAGCPCRPVFWAEADFLQWWYRAGAIPPLVTAGSALDPVPGALAEPGTRVLYGNGPGHAEWTSGGRARVGGWFSDSPIGWEVGGFYTVPQSESGLFRSNDIAILARPFYDAFLVTPSALLFGAPGAFEGSITTHTRTTFWGLEANGTAALDPSTGHVGFIGYRYLQMTDDLAIAGRYNLGPGGLAFSSGISLLPGATGLIEDRVHTRNEFNGAQLGWKYHGAYGWFGVDVRASVAVGVGSERISLAGSTQTVDADGTIRSAVGGVLVQPSNAGQFGRDLLTVVPEAGVRLSACVAPGISLYAGYDFLYWASVARAGDQLDQVVDTRQMPSSGSFTGGPGFRPLSPLRDTAFWAHGFNFGVRVEY
jgi:hypothetical protein